MLMQFRRRFVIELKEGKTRLFFVWRPVDIVKWCSGRQISPLICLPVLGKKVDADLVFQPLLCVPVFVAELTWLGFPSEVITYLSFPHKIYFLKGLTATCSFFLFWELKEVHPAQLFSKTPHVHMMLVCSSIKGGRENSRWRNVSVKASLKTA